MSYKLHPPGPLRRLNQMLTSSLQITVWVWPVCEGEIRTCRCSYCWNFLNPMFFSASVVALLAACSRRQPCFHLLCERRRLGVGRVCGWKCQRNGEKRSFCLKRLIVQTFKLRQSRGRKHRTAALSRSTFRFFEMSAKVEKENSLYYERLDKSQVIRVARVATFSYMCVELKLRHNI